MGPRGETPAGASSPKELANAGASPGAVAETAKKHRASWYKVGAWLIPILISLGALSVSIASYSGQSSARKLDNEQSQQIIELQRTTPTGQITGMVPYHPSSGEKAIANIRRNPLIFQQIYGLRGRALNIPDNGDLFIVVHNYGQRTSSFSETYSRFFLTPVNLTFGRSTVNQNWEAPGVYIGSKSAPTSVVSYRLSLYFCNSADSQKISIALQSEANRNAGLSSLPYPSCRQLDSIFVRRAPNAQ
jgi:hypothetical protein